MFRLVALLSVMAALATAALAAPASSSSAIRVGVSDQNYTDFTVPLFEDIGFTRVRYVAPWNVALKRRDRSYFDKYVKAQRAAHVELFVSLSAANGSRCPSHPCHLPTVREFTKAFKAFRKRWRSIRIISPWNEANHRSQPTFNNPKRAAQYYKIARKYCRGCTIVAADVIDETNMVSWLKKFRKYVHGSRLWGLHNYKDTNPRKGQIMGGTRKLVKAVRGPIWLTETGGIVYFKLPSGGVLFRRSESRADKALKRMFKLAKRYRSRIKRIYVYDWEQAQTRNRFDSGLLRKNGDPRAGYFTVKRNLATSSFDP